MAPGEAPFGKEKAPPPMRVLRALVDRDDVVYLQSLVEAYEGMAFTQTVDPDYLHAPGPVALVQFFAPPEFLPELRRLLESLAEETNLQVLEEFGEEEGDWQRVGRGSRKGEDD